jgi:hypothetical protein
VTNKRYLKKGNRKLEKNNIKRNKLGKGLVEINKRKEYIYNQVTLQREISVWLFV